MQSGKIKCPDKKNTLTLTHLFELSFADTNISKNTHLHVLTSLKQLSTNKDPLTLLVIENALLDIFLHRQKIQILDFTECRGSSCCSGSFCRATRTITLVDFHDQDFSQVLIHEFMHAVTCFAFSFDPFPFTEFFSPFSKPFNEKIFPISLATFLNTPTLPFPDEDNLFKSSRFNKLNPAALKFLYCVREDVKHLQQSQHVTIEKIDHFFSNLERRFPAGIFTREALEEILPAYMECRIELLRIAKNEGVSTRLALTTLAEKLPHIHAYCETDLKKILLHRLEKFQPDLLYRDIQSQFLAQYSYRNSTKVKTFFRGDGTLSLRKNDGKNESMIDQEMRDPKIMGRL